jgi:hypothetical protein
MCWEIDFRSWHYYQLLIIIILVSSSLKCIQKSVIYAEEVLQNQRRTLVRHLITSYWKALWFSNTFYVILLFWKQTKVVQVLFIKPFLGWSKKSLIWKNIKLFVCKTKHFLFPKTSFFWPVMEEKSFQTNL